MTALAILFSSGLGLVAGSQATPTPTPVVESMTLAAPEVMFPAADETATSTPTDEGRLGLAFHPEHLNAGGLCREVYSASGSLKNHGPGEPTDAAISYEVIAGEAWVDHVEVTPDAWVALGTSKPRRFTVRVFVNEDWPLAGKGSEIVVRLSASADGGASVAAEATFTVRNQCQSPTPTTSTTPTETPTLTSEGRLGLAFHPAHLNAGGRCREVYSASGSLKNHSPGEPTDAEISYEVIAGEMWVDHVEVIPDAWVALGTSKPGRFTVRVFVNEDWPLAGKGSEIIVRLSASADGGATEAAEATFRVRNLCREPKPTKEPKPTRPPKPTKMPKPVRTRKPTKMPRPTKTPRPGK